jgi:DNA-binding NtrC family response regulator
MREFGAKGVSDAARRALLANEWKGNVRELRNVIERAALLAGDRPIDVEDLVLDGAIGGPPTNGARTAASLADTRNLREIERRTILATLAEHGGNRTQTAEALGISIRTLRNKLHEYALEGIEIPRSGGGNGDE